MNSRSLESMFIEFLAWGFRFYVIRGEAVTGSEV